MASPGQKAAGGVLGILGAFIPGRNKRGDVWTDSKPEPGDAGYGQLELPNSTHYTEWVWAHELRPYTMKVLRDNGQWDTIQSILPPPSPGTVLVGFTGDNQTQYYPDGGAQVRIQT